MTACPTLKQGDECRCITQMNHALLSLHLRPGTPPPDYQPVIRAMLIADEDTPMLLKALRHLRVDLRTPACVHHTKVCGHNSKMSRARGVESGCPDCGPCS